MCISLCPIIIHPVTTSWCLMSAFTKPRADFKGGKQSEDSFATSRSTFTPSATLCLCAGSQRTVRWLIPRKVLNTLTSAWVRVTLGNSEVRRASLPKHGFVSGTERGSGAGRSSSFAGVRHNSHEARSSGGDGSRQSRTNQFILTFLILSRLESSLNSEEWRESGGRRR